jgi:predicted RNase H-like HicB family nuclease
MKYAYAAVLTPEAGGFNVAFPDLPGCYTCGDDLSDAIYMAQDALCLWLYDMELEQKPVPSVTSPIKIDLAHGEFTSIIAVDTDMYHRLNEAKAVKKTLTIPMWLNERAERANVNFSQTLQKALKEELHIPQ